MMIQSRAVVLAALVFVVAAGASIACGSGAGGGASRTATQDAAASPTPDVTLLNNELAANGEPTVPPGTDVRTPRGGDPTANAIFDATFAAISTRVIGEQRLNCGPAADRDGPLATAHGELVNAGCLQYGNFWVVLAYGDELRDQRASIAVYRCNDDDAVCQTGGEPASGGMWRISPETVFPRGEEFVAPDKLRSFTNKQCLSLTSLVYVAPSECGSGATTNRPRATPPPEPPQVQFPYVPQPPRCAPEILVRKGEPLRISGGGLPDRDIPSPGDELRDTCTGSVYFIDPATGEDLPTTNGPVEHR